MWDESDFAGGDPIDTLEKLDGFVRHDDKSRDMLFHLLQNAPLRLGRIRKHCVESDGDWHCDGTHQIENIVAVVAAIDAVLVLNRKKADFMLVEEPCGPQVIGTVLFLNGVNDFAVGMRLSRGVIVYSEHDASPAR